jgi:NADH-quinone oxidoreductase subunit D
MFVSAFGLDAGAITPTMYAFRGRERIQSVFEAVSGARMMHNYIRVGGVREDLPEDFRERMEKLLPLLREDIEACDNLLTYNEVFLARTKGIGAIDAKTAIDYGLTGPCLRACGVPYDVRKAEPYSVYDRFEFDIPVGRDGDCWDRYYVRIQEMYQSLRIIEQAMEQLPEGSVQAVNPRRLLRPPKGEVYARAENPRGEIGVYLVSDGTDKPYRVKVRPPSYCNLMALKYLLRDCYVADCVVVLGSLDIVLGEVDR